MINTQSIDECLKSLENFEIDSKCFNLIISKILGYSLILACFIIKFPQIVKIYKNSSVFGISPISTYIETFGFALLSAYSVHNQQPLSTYGEQLLIFFQCILQTLLFWKFSNVQMQTRLKYAFIFVVFWLIPLFYCDLPSQFWRYVPFSCVIMNITVKISQIKTNFSNRSTGNLSLITNLISFLGTLSRIFTTLTELNDNFLLTNYSIGAILNSIIMFQFIMYRNSPYKKVL